jgi:hypothetical protein
MRVGAVFGSLFVGIFVMLLILMLIIQVRHAWRGRNVVRQRIEVKEAFQMPSKVEDSGEELKAGLAPAGAGLEQPRAPYALLSGWLETKDPEAVRAGAYSAERCYAADFERRLERTCNYRQMTNNYKRGDPDSCTAPNQEAVLGFYKVESV